MKIEDLVNAPKIVQRQAEGALARVRAENERRDRIRDLVCGTNRSEYVGEVIVVDGSGLDDDDTENWTRAVYVVEVHGLPWGKSWTTVVRGRKDDRHFIAEDGGRWMAILHAIARVHFDDDAHGSGAFYAARVLGIKTN